MNSKPYSEIFLIACHKLNILLHETIILEDSEPGLQAASSAHIPVICILYIKYSNMCYEKNIQSFKLFRFDYKIV